MQIELKKDGEQSADGKWEELLTAKQVSELLPPGKAGGKVCAATVATYATKGVKVGEKYVKLPCVAVPSGRAYTRTGVKTFLRELTAARRRADGEDITEAEAEQILRRIGLADAGPPPRKGRRAG